MATTADIIGAEQAVIVILDYCSYLKSAGMAIMRNPWNG